MFAKILRSGLRFPDVTWCMCCQEHNTGEYISRDDMAHHRSDNYVHSDYAKIGVSR